MNKMHTERDAAREVEYAAWAVYRHRNGVAFISLCDSDTPGAFKLYTEAALRAAVEAEQEECSKVLDAAVRLAVEAEREACAHLCDLGDDVPMKGVGQVCYKCGHL